MGFFDSLFGIDMDLDGKADATDDMLFMAAMDDMERQELADDLGVDVDDLDYLEDEDLW